MIKRQLLVVSLLFFVTLFVVGDTNRHVDFYSRSTISEENDRPWKIVPPS